MLPIVFCLHFSNNVLFLYLDSGLPISYDEMLSVFENRNRILDSPYFGKRAIQIDINNSVVNVIRISVTGAFSVS